MIIAWAVQTWVEELLVKWVTNCIKKYKIPNVTISGGVALNIKAMGKISQIKVKKLFIGGSASDESMALSAGICLLDKINRSKKKNLVLRNFHKSLTGHLGPSIFIQMRKNP